MTVIHGFELLKEERIPELNTTARYFRHIRTGAELLSLENDDENKSFGVNFKTPPEDSTGLPHILEHAVLGGSRKYRTKEPFVDLLKGSLNTFLNAMTYSDMTLYPVASQNLKDFYNLVDVYMDAVFYPSITEKTFQQEGWHYELEEKDAPLIYKGVVFNEMKGAYSSPDNLLGRYVEQYLLPDTPYANDSGGDPSVIPDLTYEQFKRFHDTYYHPSNARFFFSGDDNPNERLRIVDAFIADFERLDVDAELPLQPRWPEPRHIVKQYPATEDGDSKTMMSVSWLLNEISDTETTTALQILSHILLDTPASPLRKVLIDSGLGEDVTGGLSPFQRELYFSAGMKGIAREDANKVQSLILDTLGKLAEDGIEPDMVAAAMNTIEFQMRELNTGQFPRGLALMISVVSTWMHGGDPIEALKFEGVLQHIKQRIAEDKGYFEEMIGEFFLNNPHRSTVVLEPDATLNDKLEQAELARLDKERARMNDADLLHIIDDVEALRLIQETPDTPEAQATIPSLSLSDLDRNIRMFPIEESEEGGSKILYHDIFTNGIVYLDIALNLHTLPANLLPYVRLFAQALTEIGTETMDFVKLSQQIGMKTGGIGASPFTSTILDRKDATTRLIIRGKTMADKTQDLLNILQDIFLNIKLDNPERFRQMVLEAKASAESALVPAGHSMANTRLRSHFTEAMWANEQMGGITYLFFLRQLAERINNDWASVLKDLETIRGLLFNRNAMLFNITLDPTNWTRFRPQLQAFIGSLPAGGVNVVDWERNSLPTYEGLTIPAQVNYVAKGANLFDLGYALHGSNSVITKFLGTTWLWERIRVRGGAYGGFCGFDFASGMFTYVSYRDPNLLSTLDNFDATADFLINLDLSEEELHRSIIGAVGDLDAHLLPDAKGYTSMVHYLIGQTNERRQKNRDDVLATTLADFKHFGEALAKVKEAGHIVVVGSQDAIGKANSERGDFMTVTKVL